MRAHIDDPAPNSPVAATSFVVRGWIWLDAAQPEIAAIEAWCESTLLGETGALLARPDVTSFLALPAGSLTGFAVPAARPAGNAPTFAVQVRARLRDGTRTPVLAIVTVAPLAGENDPLPLLRTHLPASALGLEIGAHALPVPGVTPFYTDAVASFADSEGRADFLADARALPLPDDTLDYLCSSHVLEHLPDPLAALREWHRVLRGGGLLYLVVPDKRYTFDVQRAITTTTHLLRDFLIGATAADSVEHVDEFVFQADWSRLRPDCPPAERPRQQAAARAHYREELQRGNPIDIHFHTFTPDSLQATLRAAGFIDARGALFELVAHAERYPRERGDGIALLLRKSRPGETRPPSETFVLTHASPAVPALPLVCPVSLEPLRLENATDGARALVATRSGRRYPLAGARISLLPPPATPTVRPWSSRPRRQLAHTTARLRLAFSR